MAIVRGWFFKTILRIIDQLHMLRINVRGILILKYFQLNFVHLDKISLVLSARWVHSRSLNSPITRTSINSNCFCISFESSLILSHKNPDIFEPSLTWTFVYYNPFYQPHRPESLSCSKFHVSTVKIKTKYDVNY